MHYARPGDERQNEHSYRRLKTTCYRAALGLVLAAPVFQITESILVLAGVDLFPKFRGLGARYTFHGPELREYLRYLIHLENHVLLLGALAIAAGLLSWVLSKLAPEATK